MGDAVLTNDTNENMSPPSVSECNMYTSLNTVRERSERKR